VAERQRLATHLEALRAAEPAISEAAPRLPRGRGGGALPLLLKWRRQRTLALAAEVARLDDAIAGARAAAAAVAAAIGAA
jgi:hypothetical protein